MPASRAKATSSASTSRTPSTRPSAATISIRFRAEESAAHQRATGRRRGRLREGLDGVEGQLLLYVRRQEAQRRPRQRLRRHRAQPAIRRRRLPRQPGARRSRPAQQRLRRRRHQFPESRTDPAHRHRPVPLRTQQPDADHARRPLRRPGEFRQPRHPAIQCRLQREDHAETARRRQRELGQIQSHRSPGSRCSSRATSATPSVSIPAWACSTVRC